MRKILTISIALLCAIGVIGGLPSSLTKPSGLGSSTNSQMLYNNNGLVAGSSAMTFNPATGDVTFTGAVTTGDNPGANAIYIKGNDTSPYDCGDTGQPATGDNAIFQNADNVIRNCMNASIGGTNATQIGWVLLDKEVITNAQATVQLNAVNWTTNFDSIVVQFINVDPTTDARFQIQNLIATTPSATSTFHNSTTISEDILAVCSGASTVTNIVTCLGGMHETGVGFYTHASHLLDAAFTLTGDMVLTRDASNKYTGIMNATYYDTSSNDAISIVSSVSSEAAGDDGFEFSLSGAVTFKGTFVLWGRNAR